MTVLPAIEPDFGHWLAGFIDGEGSFGLACDRTKLTRFQCQFSLSLRSDDREILVKCHALLGGYLYDRGRYERTPGKLTRPTTRWAIVSKSDCMRLVNVLDVYRLRSKKSRDYLLWREAVLLVHNHSYLPNGNIDWSEFIRLKRAIEDVRIYPGEHRVVAPIRRGPVRYAPNEVP